MFIQEFQSLERELTHERQGQVTLLLGGDPSSLVDSQSSILRFLSPQMREILRQIRQEPFLVNLMPHLIKFVESKS